MPRALSALGLTALLSSTAPVGPAPADAVNRVRHTVRMDNNRFTPRHLVIQVGDEVEFTNGPGGPHNVAFWPDSVPAGAPDVLRHTMPDTIGPLIGPLVFGGTEKYLISFAAAPPGVYGYYCLPHVAGGMAGTIEVKSGT